MTYNELSLPFLLMVEQLEKDISGKKRTVDLDGVAILFTERHSESLLRQKSKCEKKGTWYIVTGHLSMTTSRGMIE
jgi:hypothetical protein